VLADQNCGVESGLLSRLGRRRERSRAAIVGTLLVLSALAGFSDAAGASPGELLAAVMTAALVSWLGDAYGTFLGEGRTDTELHLRGLVRAALEEKGMLASAILPSCAVLLALVGWLSLQHAVWLAMTLCVIELFLQGAMLARHEGRGLAAVLVSGIFAMCLALLIVALKFMLE
jgi:hypothetical protein